MTSPAAALAALIAKSSGLHQSLAKSHPSLSRGIVWCVTCGASHRVDTAHCFAHGWPKCCGATMTTDSPEERAAMRARSPR